MSNLPKANPPILPTSPFTITISEECLRTLTLCLTAAILTNSGNNLDDALYLARNLYDKAKPTGV